MIPLAGMVHLGWPTRQQGTAHDEERQPPNIVSDAEAVSDEATREPHEPPSVHDAGDDQAPRPARSDINVASGGTKDDHHRHIRQRTAASEDGK
jgi:hypothetical protein